MKFKLKAKLTSNENVLDVIKAFAQIFNSKSSIYIKDMRIEAEIFFEKDFPKEFFEAFQTSDDIQFEYSIEVEETEESSKSVVVYGGKQNNIKKRKNAGGGKVEIC